MTDHACGMGQPCHGVAASGGIALRDIGPVDVLSEPNKYTGGSLVGALGQHDLVAFAEYSCSNFITHLLATSSSFCPGQDSAPSGHGYGLNFGRFTSLARSSLAFAASPSSVSRAASLCGASWSSSRVASRMAASAGASNLF